jgi:hypothetical protein
VLWRISIVDLYFPLHISVGNLKKGFASWVRVTQVSIINFPFFISTYEF